MRNFKKVIALVLALAMMLSTATVAFAAAPITSQARAEVLNALGLMDGMPSASGEFNADVTGTTNREQAMKMIASALNWTVDMEAVSDFADVSGWAQPYVAVAASMGVTNGMPDGTFGAKSVVTARQLQTWIDRALGLPMAGSWDANAGLDNSAELNRGDLVDAIFATLMTTPIGSTESLIVTICGSDAALLAIASAAGLIPEVGALAVTGVTATDATRITVTFNGAVNEASAETLGSYSVAGNNPIGAAMAADGLSVVLTFGVDEIEGTKLAVVVEPIQDAADDLVLTARYVSLLTFEDTVMPAVSEITSTTRALNSASVTVTFSEPINTIGTAKIDGVYRAPDAYAAGATSVTFSTGLSLAAADSHTIQFVGLKDQGGNTVANLTETFAVVIDTVAPTATLSAVGDHTIRVTFDKAMDLATVTPAFALNTPVVDSTTLTGLNSAAVVASVNGDNKVFDIVLATTLFDDDATRTLLVKLPATMTDSLGNAFVATTPSITLTKDDTKPVVTSIVPKLNAAGKVIGLKVTVSEGLAAVPGGLDDTGLTVVNSNGVLVDMDDWINGATLLSSDAIAAGDTSFVIKVTEGAGYTAKSGIFYVSVAADFVTDNAAAANKSDAVDLTVDFGDATADTTFTLADGSAVVGGPQVITVTYANEVKGGGVVGSATDINNYAINGTPLPSGTTITLNAAQKVATITLKEGSVATTDAAAVFTINNVTQLTGEVIVPYTQTLVVTDNTKPVMNYAVLNSDNTITIGFTESLTTAPVVADFTIKVNGTTMLVPAAAPLTIAAGTGLNAGKYVLDLDPAVLYAAPHTYVEMDGVVGYLAGDLVLKVEGSKLTNLLDGVAATTITITTTGNTGADAATNKITADTVITVK